MEHIEEGNSFGRQRLRLPTMSFSEEFIELIERQTKLIAGTAGGRPDEHPVRRQEGILYLLEVTPGLAYGALCQQGDRRTPG
jgi:hypothetical protein